MNTDFIELLLSNIDSASGSNKDDLIWDIQDQLVSDFKDFIDDGDAFDLIAKLADVLIENGNMEDEKMLYFQKER